MNDTKTVLKFFCLTLIVFITLVVAALIYSANANSSVKTYMFQMDNSPRQRVGALQDLSKISPEDLLTKLIHEYVSEYFRVVPLEKDITNRTVLQKLSEPDVFEFWQKTEALTIANKSAGKMFRFVEFPANSIEPMDKSPDYKYLPDQLVRPVYYAVHYETVTWTEPNNMDTKPVRDQGTLYIRVNFKPEIWDNINVPKDLKNGVNPVELFKFKVSDIGNKGI